MNDRQALFLPAGYELGITELDAQHGQLFDLLSELDACRGRHYSPSKAKDILGRLFQASQLHFAMEESMMRLLGYPEADAHAAAHRDLTKQFQRIQQQLIDKDIADKLYGEMEAWLVDHINKVDRHFVPHFLDAGVVAQRC